MIDVNYPNLLSLFQEHLDPRRSESASFLVWYLQNYYRLDPLEADDAVCDQPQDKGVDAVFVNDNDQTITIFQSKISRQTNRTIGDTALRDFSGILSQFQTKESIENLIKSAGSSPVASLLKRLDVANKIATHDVRGEFVVNIDIDQNGLDYLKSAPTITFIGKSKLISSYISDRRELAVHADASFDIFGYSTAEYIVDATRKAVIAPVRALDLVKLDEIEDQSIFDFNVRGPLGRTKINREIVSSIKRPDTHKLFPLFHNGITIIVGKIDVSDTKIIIAEYYVVNGCQSLTALYNNQNEITEDLRILAKFIQMDPISADAGVITAFSNNQNGVRARDFKANTQPQVRLQNEFRMNYLNDYSYEIKRGELSEGGAVISNEDAGLYLMAFDLKEPWATHRKYEVFEDKHGDIFARPEVTADRIVLCRVIIESIDGQLSKHENQLFGRYVITKYAILYIVREILESDAIASQSRIPKFIRHGSMLQACGS